MAQAQMLSPITLSVVAGTLENAIREMGDIITQTARSVVIAVGHDYSTTILGHLDGLPIMVVEGDDQPVHLGDLPNKLKEGVRYFGSDFAPGDVIFHNDPATGGNHFPDISMYKPVFADGTLIAWSAVTCHIPEVGGPVPGGFNPDAEEFFAEGLRIPHVKIEAEGKHREDVWNFILSNVRTPEAMRGDMGAMLSAVNAGERRIIELCGKYGVETVRKCMSQLVERAEEVARAEIMAMPNGIYKGKSIMEGDDRGTGDIEIEIECTVEIDGEEMHISFLAPPQTQSDINSYKNNSLSAVFIAYISSMSPGGPINEGLYKPLHVDLGPEGTVINASPPAACYTSTASTYVLICDAVTDALSKANPGRTCPSWSFPHNTVFTGVDPRDGEHFAYYCHFATMGGGGAYYGNDGTHMSGHPGTMGAHNIGDVELIEFRAPVHIHQLELQPNSGCPGRWRGGLGVVFDVEIQCDKCIVTAAGSGFKFSPTSRLGGEALLDNQTRLNKKSIKRTSGETEVLSWRFVTNLLRQERLIGQMSGGGAVGPAWERDVYAVEEDVLNGLVTLEKAKEEYGVIINDDTMTINHEQTHHLRELKCLND